MALTLALVFFLISLVSCSAQTISLPSCVQPSKEIDTWYRLKLNGKKYGWQRVTIHEVPLESGTGYQTRVLTHCQCLLDDTQVYLDYEFQGLADERLQALRHVSTLQRGQELRQLQGTRQGDHYVVESLIHGNRYRLSYPVEDRLSFVPLIFLRLNHPTDFSDRDSDFRAFHDELGRVVTYDVRSIRRRLTGFHARLNLMEFDTFPVYLKGAKESHPRRIDFPSIGLRALAVSEKRAKNMKGSVCTMSSEIPLRRTDTSWPPKTKGTFLIRQKGADLSGLFHETPYQTIAWPKRSKRDRLVVSVSPPQLPNTEPSAFIQSYLAPGPYVQSHDEEIIDAALRYGGEGTKAQIVRRLVRWVHENIAPAGVEGSMRSAKDAFESRSGDCTECACLLAALCRARGIPCRICAGLVALGDICGLHAWNEVAIGQTWIPVDSALNTTPIPPSHLLMALEQEEDPFLSLLTLVGYRFSTKTTIEVCPNESF